MTEKRVSIEAADEKGVNALVGNTTLGTDFMKVAARCPSAVLKCTPTSFSFSIGYADFKALAAENTFPAPIVAAFEDSDARLQAYDASRKSFLKQLWDDMRNRERIMEGRSVAQAATPIADMESAFVSVKNYGFNN